MNGAAAIGRTEPGSRVGDLVKGDAEFRGNGGRGQNVRQVAATEQRGVDDGLARPASPRGRIPDSPRSSIAVARTVGAIGRAERDRPAGKPATRDITRGSSALQTSTVDGVARSRISAFRIGNRVGEAKKPRCASPTFVQTRTSGSAIATRVLISPAWFIPSSITATSGACRTCISESGRPMWLFNCPCSSPPSCAVRGTPQSFPSSSSCPHCP